MRPLLVLALLSGTALAGRHTVQRGETLEHVAKIYGCSTEAVLRANNLNNTLVPPGTVVRVPDCAVRPRAQARARATARATDSPDAKAAAALAVIDGTTTVRAPADDDDDHGGIMSGGDGGVADARMPKGEGYELRRPSRAFGEVHVLDHLQRAIAEVRALYPDLHTLAIGDISARGGGKLSNHLSHRTGLDVDVGFYFTRVPAGYPDAFAPATADLDLQATWALLTAFTRTAGLDTGVQMIFLDYDVQARLYEFAKQRGTPASDLAAIFQYPRGKDAFAGIVRHWPHHADHMHVRFKPAE